MDSFAQRSVRPATWLIPLLLVACAPRDAEWEPLLEGTSVTFLSSAVGAVGEHVRKARETVDSDPAVSADELDRAQEAIGNLLGYDLPLLEARQLAYNAYRHYQLGESAAATPELDRIESLLIGVAESGPAHVLGELEEPLRNLEVARATLDERTPETATALRSLATRLNLLLLKGDLVLRNP